MAHELTEQEQKDLARRKAYFPFRTWFAVKTSAATAEFFDSKRKAMNFARKQGNATVWAAQ